MCLNFEKLRHSSFNFISEDRLFNKQESYDSHARRGGSGDVGEGTPVTPLAGDVPVIPSTSTKDAEEQGMIELNVLKDKLSI